MTLMAVQLSLSLRSASGLCPSLRAGSAFCCLSVLECTGQCTKLAMCLYIYGDLSAASIRACSSACLCCLLTHSRSTREKFKVSYQGAVGKNRLTLKACQLSAIFLCSLAAYLMLKEVMCACQPAVKMAGISRIRQQALISLLRLLPSASSL